MANANAATVEPVEEPRGLVASAAWRTEDWIAVLIGCVVIAAVLGAFHWKVLDPGKVTSTYRWTTDAQLASMTPGWIAKLDAISAAAPSRDVVTLSSALRQALEKGERKAIEAAAGKMAKLGSRTLPGALGQEIRGHAAADAAARVFAWSNLAPVLYVGIALLILAAAGIGLLGVRVLPFVIGLPA